MKSNFETVSEAMWDLMERDIAADQATKIKLVQSHGWDWCEYLQEHERQMSRMAACKDQWRVWGNQ